MINIDTLQSDLRNIIATLTAQNVIWQDENGNIPDGDFIFLKINNLEKLFYRDYSGNYNVSFGKAKTQGDREFILNVQCISKDSFGILTNMVSKLDLEENQELLGKIVFVEQDGNVTDITTKIGDRFEKRATVDLRFRVSKNYTTDEGDNTSFIETIEIESNIDGFQNNFVS